MTTKVLVLDAMGVIFSVGDDVKDLLFPFIFEKGGTKDTALINQSYRSASLGEISAFEFWMTVGIDPRLEDEYLQRHKPATGLLYFLDAVKSHKLEIWCLSNDLSEWSKKLRDKFELDRYFNGFVISGDVYIRKPDPLIYQHLLRQLKVSANDVTFVDDRPGNLDAALALGITTILFKAEGGEILNSRHVKASSFGEILKFLNLV
jgi:HAD superfamily hydrolase (TIGR01509 family)